MRDGSPRILIVQLSAIGDVVRVIPAMHALRDVYPRARIDWAVERKSASIIADHPSIDELQVFERSAKREGSALANMGQFRLFLSHIRANRYDIVLDFHGSVKSGIVARWSRAKERYGFAGPEAREARRVRAGSWWSVNKPVRLPSSVMNRVEENLRLVEPLAGIPKRPNFSIYVPDETHDLIDGYFEETFTGGKYVIAMHAPMDRADKRLPLELFGQAADMLMSDGRFELILTYGPGQRDIALRVQEMTRRKPAIAHETRDLRQYAWLVHRCDMYVGGDTGPMHIAAAMGTPVVAIFGATDPRKHAPYNLPHEIVRDEGALTAEHVYDACVRMLTRCRPAVSDFVPNTSGAEDEYFDSV